MVSERSKRKMERIYRELAPERTCQLCEKRPVHHSEYCFERWLCRRCGAEAQAMDDRLAAERRRRAHLEREADRPDEDIPRYITWLGWTIGYGGREGKHLLWLPYSQFCGEGVKGLPSKGVADLNGYVKGLTREQVKRYKAHIKGLFASKNGQLADIRVVEKPKRVSKYSKAAA